MTSTRVYLLFTSIPILKPAKYYFFSEDRLSTDDSERNWRESSADVPSHSPSAAAAALSSAAFSLQSSSQEVALEEEMPLSSAAGSCFQEIPLFDNEYAKPRQNREVPPPPSYPLPEPPITNSPPTPPLPPPPPELTLEKPSLPVKTFLATKRLATVHKLNDFSTFKSTEAEISLNSTKKRPSMLKRTKSLLGKKPEMVSKATQTNLTIKWTD